MVICGVAIPSENDSINFFITDLLAEESACYTILHVYTQILAIYYHDLMQFVYCNN